MRAGSVAGLSCGARSGGRPEMRFSRAMMTRMSPWWRMGNSRRAKPAWRSRSRSPAALLCLGRLRRVPILLTSAGGGSKGGPPAARTAQGVRWEYLRDRTRSGSWLPPRVLGRREETRGRERATRRQGDSDPKAHAGSLLSTLRSRLSSRRRRFPSCSRWASWFSLQER